MSEEQKTPEAQQTAQEKPTPTKRTRSKKAKKVNKKPSAKTPKQRVIRSFPASTFEDALTIAQAIQQFAAGARVRRITLFDNLNKSPDSGASRALVTNSSRYGLTSGGYTAEYLELTPEGKIASSQEVAPVEQLSAKFKLSIDQISPFKALYDQYKGGKVPNQAVLRDFLTEKGYKKEEVSECVETFILNAKFLGILRPVAGAERLLTIDHILEEVGKINLDNSFPIAQFGSQTVSIVGAKMGSLSDLKDTCFYVTPIGSPDSEQRKHSDLFLNSIVEPALSEFNLRVVRADQIAQPGIITKQIIEHILYSRIVIADLSFHNPNVFYELSLRHACRLPVVQLIRAHEKIPFDLDQFRTIQIDTSDIYTLVPQIETYKAEIANQVRRALSDPDAVDNPISLFFPGIKVTLP